MNIHFIQRDVASALVFVEQFSCLQNLAIVHSETIKTFESKAHRYAPDCILLDVPASDFSSVLSDLKALDKISRAPVILLTDGDVPSLESLTRKTDILGVAVRSEQSCAQICQLLSAVQLVGFDPVI